MSKKRSRILFAMILTAAMSASTPLFAADSKNVLKTYNEAVELQNEENWYTASQYFIEVVNSNPAFSDAWFRLADCSYHLGEFDLAFQYLESAEKYEKDRSQIKNLKGMILLQKEKYCQPQKQKSMQLKPLLIFYSSSLPSSVFLIIFTILIR